MTQEEDNDLSLLKSACASLSERFDTVMIFVTRKEGNNTVNARWGVGDWFSRYGHISLWVEREKKGGLSNNDNDKEDWV